MKVIFFTQHFQKAKGNLYASSLTDPQLIPIRCRKSKVEEWNNTVVYKEPLPNTEFRS